MPAHSHQFFEMVYFESGTGVHWIAEKGFKIRPGDIHCIRPGEVHDLRQVGTAKGWIVLFQPNFLTTINTDAQSVPWTFQPLLQPFLPVRKNSSTGKSSTETSIAVKD
jgi:quercetin dioxygenase-like cupin family protein